MTKLWFAAKRYGYGWYPVTWEGWLVTLGYVVGVVGAIPLFAFLLSTEKDEIETSIVFLGWVIILTIVLLWICVKKGEKARWRWGGK